MMNTASAVVGAVAWPRRLALALACSTTLALSIAPAVAFEIVNDPDLKITWDNTFKYSTAFRVRGINPNVANESVGVQANTNDGDLNFNRGLISNRIDLLSEFDVRWHKDYGFRISGAGWYDSVYHELNDNPAAYNGALVNSRSVGPNQFTAATSDLQGGMSEILDAFVYGNFTPHDVGINVKLGQFTQLYGESLFFGNNGIAQAQTSLDLIKALSVPNSQFKEIMRPTDQISTQVELTTNISFGAYYQFNWERTRIPGAGSYFSFADFVDVGGESLILGPGATAYRGRDIVPDNGQGGLQFRLKAGDFEFGFYAAQFDEKIPQFYVRPGVDVQEGSIGDYVEVFGKNIRTYGASVSTLVGDANVAGEVSVRDNQPLVASGNAVILPPGDTQADGGSNAAFPVGRTLHANLSTIKVFSESPFWSGATFLGELAFNRRLSVERNEDQLDPHATRDATALQFLFTPEYFQVRPGIDLQVPIGLSYGLSGRSSVNGVLFPSTHGGTMSVGVKADFRRTWQASLTFNHYYGAAGSIILYDTPVPELSYKNFFGDRDFVSLSIQRTF